MHPQGEQPVDEYREEERRVEDRATLAFDRGEDPRNGSMIRSVARKTQRTKGVLWFALNSSRKNAIAKITEQAIANP